MADQRRTPGKPGPKSLSSEHKAALAAGRARSRTVRRYLEARARSAQIDAGQARRRLASIAAELPAASSVQRLHLAQERVTLERALTTLDVDTLAALEDEFVAVARSYSEQKGISYAAWRAVGVERAVLRRAGIHPPPT